MPVSHQGLSPRLESYGFLEWCTAGCTTGDHSIHGIHGIHWSFQHQFRGFMFNRGSQGTREDTESPVCCCFLGQVLVMPILWLKHSEISSKVDGIITSIQLFHELKTPTKCRSILATAAAPSSSSSSWMRTQHRIPKECRVMYGNMEVS